MIALLQRVTQARVEVDGVDIASIGKGLLVFIAVERGDDSQSVMRMAEKLCRYRVFADQDDKMNMSVVDIGAELLLVPQFTLAADTAKGLRPSFHLAADPEFGEQQFQALLSAVRQQAVEPQQGQFGANMQVHLTNDGPVTFWLQTQS